MREDVTPLEYWLLDCVVEHSFPFVFLLSPNLDELINRPGHGVGRAELVDGMAGLFGRGLVVATQGGIGSEVRLSAEEIDRALDDHPAGCSAWTYYGLTDAGGRVWESLSSPRWERYIEYRRSYVAPGMWMDEATGTDAGLVERCYGHVRREYVEGAVDPDTIDRSEMRPRIASYWKLLPQAYRIVYFGREDRDPLYATPDKPFATDPEFVTGSPVWYTRSRPLRGDAGSPAAS